MRTWTDNEIEELYRRYNFNKELLELLSEPSVASQLRTDKSSSGGFEQSKAEMVAIKRAQASIDVKIVEACLKIMNKEEREFIGLRYFEDEDIKVIASCMCCSERKVYKIRDQVINKTRELLSLAA